MRVPLPGYQLFHGLPGAWNPGLDYPHGVNSPTRPSHVRSGAVGQITVISALRPV
jgi:hypothetical protein